MNTTQTEKDLVCEQLTEVSFLLEEMKAKEQVYLEQLEEQKQKAIADIAALEGERDRTESNLKEATYRFEHERDDLTSRLEEKTLQLDQTERSLLKVFFHW